MEQIAKFMGAIIGYWKWSGIGILITATIGSLCGLVNLELLGIIGILLITDTISGIMAAYKEKEEITSQRMRNVITKMVMYFIFLTALHQAGKGILIITGIDLVKIIDLAAAGICFSVELKSNVENFGRLGFKIPQQINDFINGHLKK